MRGGFLEVARGLTMGCTLGKGFWGLSSLSILNVSIIDASSTD